MSIEKNFFSDGNDAKTKIDGFNISNSENIEKDSASAGRFEMLFPDMVQDGRPKIPDNFQDPLELAKLAVRVLELKKASGIKLLRVGDKSHNCRLFYTLYRNV